MNLFHPKLTTHIWIWVYFMTILIVSLQGGAFISDTFVIILEESSEGIANVFFFSSVLQVMPQSFEWWNTLTYKWEFTCIYQKIEGKHHCNHPHYCSRHIACSNEQYADLLSGMQQFQWGSFVRYTIYATMLYLSIISHLCALNYVLYANLCCSLIF